MSYKQVVLRDNPIAFWPLNGTSSLRTYATILLEYKTYQDWLNAEPTYGSDPITFTLQDISNSGNHAAYTIGSPNFLDILPLATLSSYDTQLAGCKIDSVSEVGIVNQYSPTGFGSTPLYNMFYTGTENLSFGMEMWLSFDSNPPLDNDVLSVVYNNTEIAQVYINNDKIYFTINGKNKNTGQALSYTTYKQVKSWSSQCHLFVYYSKGTINIAINDMYGNSIQTDSNFIWSNDIFAAPDFFYKIGPASSSNNFVINDLSFYDYVLSDNQIKSHMVWGSRNSNPVSYAQQTSAYAFDIKEQANMYAYSKDFSNPANYKQGVINNLIADSSGLTLQTIPSLTQAGSGSISTLSGSLSVTGTASAKISNISNYFSPTNMSIVGQINWNSSLNSNYPGVIAAIEGINSDEWFYLAQDTSNKLTLFYYSVSNTYPYAASNTALISLPSQNISGLYNFGLSFNGGLATIYMSNTGTASTNNMPGYNYTNLNLYFGNQYSRASTSAMVGSLKNVSILPIYVNPSTYTNYGNNDSFTMTFNNTLAVAQKGTWTYTVPSSQFTKVVGSRLTWDSGTSDSSTISLNQNVSFQYSEDYGNTWSQVTNGYPVTKFADSSTIAYTDTTFKATMFVQDSSSPNLPRLDNLFIAFYKDLSILSDAGAYLLEPRQGSYTGDTYSIKKNFFNILARGENFGIKVDEVNGSNSVATIVPTGNAAGYQTVEFWFKYDSLSSTAVQVILDTLGTQGTLYFEPTSGTIYQIGLSNVYINGVALASGRVLTQGESYHFVCVYPNVTNSSLYLGGDKGLNNFTYGSFGYITIYPNALQQTDAQSRYLSFLASNTSQIDYSTLLSGASNIIGTLAEYAGSSTGYNGGNPILSYTHPTNNA